MLLQWRPTALTHRTVSDAVGPTIAATCRRSSGPEPLNDHVLPFRKPVSQITITATFPLAAKVDLYCTHSFRPPAHTHRRDRGVFGSDTLPLLVLSYMEWFMTTTSLFEINTWSKSHWDTLQVPFNKNLNWFQHSSWVHFFVVGVGSVFLEMTV